MDRRQATQRIVVGALLLTATAFTCARFPFTGAYAAVAIPSGLPTHFGLGLAGSKDQNGTLTIDSWMPQSGIPWDYAYYYLNASWPSWTYAPSFPKNSSWPNYFASHAASHSYIPVFDYYAIYGSSGGSGSTNMQTDLTHLNSTSYMATYFQNFALLMQRLGTGTYGGVTGYGKTVIVDIEPDLDGFAQRAVLDNAAFCYGYCTGQGNNPAYLKASVASSGFAPVSGYPNTYQGYNWALLHLRDLYAPNVTMAYHVDWGGNNPLKFSSVTAKGQNAGDFANQSGMQTAPTGTSHYDLFFVDRDDRDAAYKQYVQNNSSYWYDQLNVTLPDFHNWEAWVSGVHATTGKVGMVWQVPLGNQYFDTENNTTHHWQDNSAQYFFGHINELVNSGLIGMMFGSGDPNQTVYWDADKDGVVNPPSFCTTDGLSSGSVCNNHSSTVADDDGGYIRMAGRQYYSTGGHPL